MNDANGYKIPAPRYLTLGDLLGSLRYEGSCVECRRQFLSRSIIVGQVSRSYNSASHPGLCYEVTMCKACAEKDPTNF